MTSEDVRSTSMGAPGEDVLLSPRARTLTPYSIECKSRAGIAVYEWLQQRMGSSFPPLVFAKANHKEPIAILYATDFMMLLKKANNE